MQFTRTRDPFLISERELARLVLDQLDAAVVICDSSGVIVLANPAAQALYGGDPIGLPFGDALPLTWLDKENDSGASRQDVAFSVDAVLKGGSLRGLCLFARDAEQRRVLMLKSAPYRDQKGEFFGCIVSMLDVTAFETAQSRLTAVVEGTTDGIYVKDSASRYLLINRAGAAAIGLTADEIIGKSPYELFDRETAQELVADDEQVMRAGIPETFENRVSLPVGNRIYSSVKAPYRDRVGEIIGTVGVSRDVTEMRRAEEKLARQAALLDLSPDAILVRNMEGKILFWSRGATQLYGWEPTEILGKNKFEVLKPEYPVSVELVNERLSRDGHWEGEIIHHRRDGGSLYVATRKVIQYDEQHKPELVFEVNEDITERKRAEETQAFLAFAAAEFASSLDFDATLKRIADLAVPRLADWCAVHILMDEQVICRLAFAHRDPDMVARVTARPQQYSLDSNATHLVPHVLKTGIAEFQNEVSDELLAESARDEAHLDTLRTLGLAAYMCIPLRARDRTLGTVTFAMSDSGRSYTTHDYELAQELVRRAGLAADNASLYSESQAAQTRLKIVAEASSELTASLDYQTRLERVANLMVPRFCDWCAINLIASDDSIRLAALVHVNPDQLRIIQKWATENPLMPDAPTGTPNVIRTGKAEWVSDATLPPNRRGDDGLWNEYRIQLQVCSYIIVPLAARGRILGAISFVQGESRRHFTRLDLDTAEEIARRTAIALDNASLFHQEQQARREAEENALRISVLQNVTDLLAGAIEPKRVARVAIEQCLQVLAAHAGSVVLRSTDGETIELLEAIGYSSEMVENWRSFPLTLATPLSDAIRNQETILVSGRESLLAAYSGFVQRASDLSGNAWAVIPMRVEGRVLGAIGLTFLDEREFDEEDRVFMSLLGLQAAHAMDRARLFESELAARRAAEFAARRSAWLTQASHILNSSLEYETTFRELAQLAVPYLADWCRIHHMKDDGTADQLVLAHQDPAQVQWAETYIAEIRQTFASRRDSPIGLPNVLRTGKAEIYPDVTDALLQQVAENELQLEILRGVGCTSVMIVPMNASGKTLGAITLVNTESRRHFTQDDLAFAELLAERAASAIENASLFREKESLALELEERVEQRTFELSEAYTDLSKEVVDRTRAEETMRSLLRTSTKLNSTLDVETSLELLIKEALRVVNGLGGFAGLRTLHGMRMRKFYANGKSFAVDYTWAPGAGIPGWVLEHRVPYVTNDAQNDPVILRALPFNRAVKKLICTPIFDAQDQVLGFFEIRDKVGGGEFTRADVDFMMALSPVASIAIQNAQAYQRLSEAEHAVKDSYAQLRALAARLQTIREEERTDIARELHDELGQALTALKMDVALLINTLPKRNKLLLERARAMIEQIDATIKTVRRLSSQLRPGMLDDLGLGPSVEWYAQEFQARTGIEVQADIIQDELPLTHAQATAFFRIFQETLTNVARHANATRVTAKLELQESELVLEITDNGQGFEMDEVRVKRSLGFLGMRERAENVQGRLEIQTQPGAGTTIRVAVPLELTVT